MRKVSLCNICEEAGFYSVSGIFMIRAWAIWTRDRKLGFALIVMACGNLGFFIADIYATYYHFNSSSIVLSNIEGSFAKIIFSGVLTLS